MSDELLKNQSWWKKYWLWILPLLGIIVISGWLIISSGIAGPAADIAKAFTDEDLYANALEIVREDNRATDLLGEIEKIDKMAIIEGAVDYSAGFNEVRTTVRITGTKGRALMDLTARRANNEWKYEKINLRIKKPVDLKQVLEIL